MGGIFLSAMDITAVAPAMPRIAAALGGGALYAWAFAVYAVLSTTTTPVFGRLADRHGRRPVFLLGIALFLAGSVASGAAPSMAFFLAARGLQGIGAGALLPTAFTIVGDIYDLEGRARVQGFLSGVWGVASVLGPLVGGTLVETVGWRWIFYMNIPVGIVAAALVVRNLTEDVKAENPAKLDFLGGTFFSGAVMLLLVGMKLEGLAAAAVFAAATASAVLFVLRERAAAEPLFDLALFRIPVYRAANAAGFFAGAVLLSLSAYLPVYVMNVRGGSAVVSGLMLTPLSMGWLIAATTGGRLLVRRSWRGIVLPGLGLLVGTTFAISRIGPETPWAFVLGALFLTGIGFGLSFTVFLVAVQEEAPAGRRGQATSAVQFFRQIGGALGVAVLELVFLAHLPDPSLLEAGPGSGPGGAARAELMAGFDASFLLAAAFAALAFLSSLLGRGTAGVADGRTSA